MTPIEILKRLEIEEELELKESKELHGNLLKLSSKDMITFNILEVNKYVLTDEGEDIIRNNSPEYILYKRLIKNKDLKIKDCDKQILGNAIKQKLIKLVFNNLVIENEDLKDFTKEQLKDLKNNNENINKELLKRKLIKKIKEKIYKIFKGNNYATEMKPSISTVNYQNIFLENLTLKKYNFDTEGVLKNFGSLHPLLKLKEEFKNIFKEMGFTEMNTNKFIESSFWNFDALFQPQLHPSREMHDTFFLKDNNENKGSKTLEIPVDYLKNVESAHLGINFKTKGYKTFNREECYKNVLRTHTTATSTRYLYNLASDLATNKINKKDLNKKYFSIDKVFRNESVDATHLAEFHQIEGLVVGKNLNISHLKGILFEFFKKVGLKKIKFKPAFNPYTEPSMEVFAFHEELNVWMEVGNSGIFRPEMLEPMGFDSDIKVVAWGLSLERPAMIKFGKKNIRELMGHKVDLKFVKETGFVQF